METQSFRGGKAAGCKKKKKKKPGKRQKCSCTSQVPPRVWGSLPTAARSSWEPPALVAAWFLCRTWAGRQRSQWEFGADEPSHLTLVKFHVRGEEQMKLDPATQQRDRGTAILGVRFVKWDFTLGGDGGGGEVGKRERTSWNFKDFKAPELHCTPSPSRTPLGVSTSSSPLLPPLGAPCPEHCHATRQLGYLTTSGPDDTSFLTTQFQMCDAYSTQNLLR